MIGPAPPLSLSCVSLPCRRDRPVPGDPVKRLAAPLAIQAAGEREIPGDDQDALALLVAAATHGAALPGLR